MEQEFYEYFKSIGMGDNSKPRVYEICELQNELQLACTIS